MELANEPARSGECLSLAGAAVTSNTVTMADVIKEKDRQASHLVTCCVEENAKNGMVYVRNAKRSRLVG